MDALGIKPVTIQSLPTQAGKSTPVLPKSSAPVLQAPKEASAPEFDAKVAEQKRYEAVQQMARTANTYVVSDRTFTIFKDSSGQYITRFTSLRDGRVTYIPEPDLAKMSGSGSGLSTVSIKA
ncbi:MAG: hypothetical protein ACK502_00665 [Alphaproteobacteria bacterium]